MKSASGLPAVFAYVGSLPRSGPVVAVAPAAANVWQAPHWLFLKTAAPATPALGDVTAVDWLWSHLSNAAGLITIACVRITEWPRPQSSVQITGKVPSRFGVMWRCVVIPGTASSFCENSGTQNEWITSFAVKLRSTERSFGSRRTPLVRPFASG